MVSGLAMQAGIEKAGATRHWELLPLGGRLEEAYEFLYNKANYVT